MNQNTSGVVAGCRRGDGAASDAARIARMIQISESAQTHFRKLIEREALPGLGVRLSAVHPGTPHADVRLEFAEPGDLQGDEWAIDCEGFTLWVDAASVQLPRRRRDRLRAPGHRRPAADPRAEDQGRGAGRIGLAGRARALGGRARDQSAAGAAQAAMSSVQEVTGRRRGGAALRRRLPRLRHGRRDPEAGHREDAADARCRA